MARFHLFSFKKNIYALFLMFLCLLVVMYTILLNDKPISIYYNINICFISSFIYLGETLCNS